jgi:hypothetical protein
MNLFYVLWSELLIRLGIECRSCSARTTRGQHCHPNCRLRENCCEECAEL